MIFPKFPQDTKQHMPFVNQINGKIEFLVCLTKKSKHNWKIYRWNGVSWIRLTNAVDDVIECNPSVYEYNNKVFYSWGVANVHNPGGIFKYWVEKSDLNKDTILIDYYEENNSHLEILNESHTYGCSWNGIDYIDGINKNIFNGVDLSSVSDYIYAVHGNPGGGFIITYKKNGQNKAGLMTNDKKFYHLTRENGKEMYKPCFLDGEWFTVVSIKGDDTEIRMIKKCKQVNMEEIKL